MSRTVVETFVHGRYKADVYQDESAEDPESMTDIPVYLYHNHRSLAHANPALPFYRARGKRPDYASMDQAFLDMFVNQPGPEEDEPKQEDFEDEEDFQHAHATWTKEREQQLSEWEEERSGWAVFLVDAYIHSGIHLTLNGSLEAASLPDRQWDVSTCGAILVAKDGEWGWEGKEAGLPAPEDFFEKIAKAHLDEWNQYLGGEVYYVEIGFAKHDPSPKGESNEWTCSTCDAPVYKRKGEWKHAEAPDLLDNCGGLYGMEAAKEHAMHEMTWRSRPIEARDTTATLSKGQS